MSRVFSSRPQSWPKVFRPNSFPVHSKPKGQK